MLTMQISRVIAECTFYLSSGDGWAELLPEPIKFLVDILNHAHWLRMVYQCRSSKQRLENYKRLCWKLWEINIGGIKEEMDELKAYLNAAQIFTWALCLAVKAECLIPIITVCSWIKFSLTGCEYRELGLTKYYSHLSTMARMLESGINSVPE